MNILFVTATRIGDAILSTGLLSHLIERYPEARITLACGPSAAPLFAAMPNLERLVVLRKRPMHLHWLDLWRYSVGRVWDVVVDLRGSGLAWSVLARRRYIATREAPDIHQRRLMFPKNL